MFKTSFRLLVASALAVGLLTCSAAYAGDNTGNAGIRRGGADGDGGTVTVTVTPERGAPKTFTVNVDPGQSSQETMRKVREAINRDRDLTATENNFRLGRWGGTIDIDNARIRSINARFQIKSIKVDPDQSGHREHGGARTASLNNKRFGLWDQGPALPGFVKLRALLADNGQVVHEFELLFLNGTPANTILADASMALDSAGYLNVLESNALTLIDVPETRQVYMGLTAEPGLLNTAYGQSSEAIVPEPATLALLVLGAPLALWRQR